MKKILAIAPYSYLPYFSGGQKFIAKFLEHLGHEVELCVVSVAENDQALANSYELLPLLKKPFSRYYDQSLVKKIGELVKKNGYDAIIWEHPYFGWLARKIKKRTGIRTIIHTHNIEYQRFRSLGKWWWPILRSYERKCLQQADGIYFITKEDRDFAIDQWKIPAEKTWIVPFGVDQQDSPADKSEAADRIKAKHNIPANTTLLLFNGLLNYKPNLDALKLILNIINPQLKAQPNFSYRIIICGKGLPAEMNELKEFATANIIYAGFVENIEDYFKAAAIFLNPVMAGGGIKTKMVEAIAFGATVISTQSGAAGMDPSVAGEKLKVIADNDWASFCSKIVEVANKALVPTPSSFYNEYGWKGIIKKVLQSF